MNYTFIKKFNYIQLHFIFYQQYQWQLKQLLLKEFKIPLELCNQIILNIFNGFPFI